MADFFEEQFGESMAQSDGEASLAASKSPNKTKQADEEGQLTVDVYQTDDEIIIKSTIAGVTADDIDVSITNEMVTIKGRREHEEKIKASDYYYQELYWGSFSRSIILPEEIDADSAKASMKNGVLTLRLPKLAKNKIKKVRVAS
ncbi:MAG: Hsp20/alpha crystallin family protein [bacterium]|nr:Hsp20/alpha crystallin family protein [bacterium]